MFKLFVQAEPAALAIWPPIKLFEIIFPSDNKPALKRILMIDNPIELGGLTKSLKKLLPEIFQLLPVPTSVLIP